MSNPRAPENLSAAVTMELDADNSLLQTLAQGKAMDLDHWPSLLSRLMTRLEKIIIYSFPCPANRTDFASKEQSSNQLPDPEREHSEHSATEEDAKKKQRISFSPTRFAFASFFYHFYALHSFLQSSSSHNSETSRTPPFTLFPLSYALFLPTCS